MDDTQRAMLLFSQSVCALVDALGKMSENMARQHRGEAMAYPDSAFYDVITRYGIHWNQAIATLQGR